MDLNPHNSSLNYQKYGDRTSSLISLYPHFESFKSKELEGEIRYIEKKSVAAIANEPLSPHKFRKNFVQQFFQSAELKNKDTLAFPISKNLAQELKQDGIHVWQIGVEPVFILTDYFSDNADPLASFPIARNLKRRGARIREISNEQLSSLNFEITELKKDWLSNKKLAPFEFLNVVDPLACEKDKRYFVLNDKNKIMALLSASPIFLEGQIIGYFFNDILKSAGARSATSELLIIEAMAILHQEGVPEVRLGMCPLAMISPNERDAKKLNALYEKWKWGYQFKSLFQFKKKLNPTRWQPLYLASARPEFSRMILNVMKVHLSPGFFLEFLKRNWYASRKSLELKDQVKPKLLPHVASKKTQKILPKIKLSLIFFCFFIGLHYLKSNSSIVQDLYEISAYIPKEVTLHGLIIGPLFHNHLMHLLGDQLSFIIFAGVLEYHFGRFFFLWITSLGLWLSNPVTHLILASTLKFSSDFWWGKVLSEEDYGSSNAVFALVGASLYALKKSAWLFWPFAVHALFICLQRESFLAVHHLAGIFLGYFGAFCFFYYPIKTSPIQC